MDGYPANPRTALNRFAMTTRLNAHIGQPAIHALGMFLCAAVGITGLFPPSEAHAIPAFARKYAVTCTTCHTAPPRLNTFGERFLENGYQLPGTEDGGSIGKKNLDDISLDDVSHYLGARLRGNVLRSYRFKQQNPAGTEPGIVENKSELGFPEVFSLFTAGTLSKNIGFFVELESNLKERATGIERAFLTFDNLMGQDLIHIRIGRLDPSAASSFSTLRQQLDTIGESINSSSNVVQRAGLLPLATVGKFYGLRDRSGAVLSPYTPALYNGVAETGIEIRGRPFGEWVLYQLGVLNGAHEGSGDSNKGKDLYGAIRFDYAQSSHFSASMTGFAYIGNSNAMVFNGTNNADVSWNRYGIAGHARYKMVDVYGMYTMDHIRHLPSAVSASFDKTASGLSIAADAYVTNQTLLSLRYDHMDAGGERTQRASQSVVGAQVKHYLRTNVALYARGDANVRKAEDGNTAARNLRNAVFLGIDIAY